MSSRELLFAAVADDDTGATDLAGMLAGNGMRTVLLIDLPNPEQCDAWLRGQDAVVAGVGTRALPPTEAVARTEAALRLLARYNPRQYAIKYCSTFDSTSDGNIGCTIDAAMRVLGQPFTIALPALPVNGRTTYLGHHFVYGQLLSDSPMRHHPLTPMTDSNLVRHLQAQTKRRVGLLSKHDIDAHRIASRLEQLRKDGVEIALLDCTNDADLEALTQAIAGLLLITGSSAPAIHLPAIWRRQGLIPERSETSRVPEAPPSSDDGLGFLAVAGSCSEATRRQNARAMAIGFRHFPLDAGRLLQDEDALTAIIQNVAAALAQDDNCLLSISADPEAVRHVQALAAQRGMSVAESGLLIANRLGALVRAIFEVRAPAGLLTAGGETSSAVCRALELGALQVGPNLEPGIPLCHSLGRFRLPAVLKSGNFGSDDFYRIAMTSIRRVQETG